MDQAASNMSDEQPTEGATGSHLESLSHQDNDTVFMTSEAQSDSAKLMKKEGISDGNPTGLVLGRKRKEYPSEGDDVGDDRSEQPPRSVGQDGSGRTKKPKLEYGNPASHRLPLPMEIWQYIFLFLDPKTLGSFLRVNKNFYSFLTSKAGGQTENSASTQGILKPMSANSIWSSVRKSFYPGMPRPLANMTELDMWRLIGTTVCQDCGKNDQNNELPTANLPPWEKGPGTNGVRIFWPFGIRTCSKCFLERTKKDVDLVLSSFPSPLLPGLSFVLLTPSMHMVSSVALRSSNIPTNLHLAKYFSNSEIDHLMNELHHVKSLGSAVLEEWMKGLESMGKRKLADAARWEQWENSGGLHEVKLRYHRKTTNSPPHSHYMHRSKGSSLSPSRSVIAAISPGYIHGTLAPLNSHYRRSGSSPLDSSRSQQIRGERSLRDVDEAKASRRAEIERRCLALHPPLTAAVLSHMDSFSAAIQIPHELTDKDWEYLKPRLLAQREMAESKEIERLQESQLLQAKTEERRQQEARLKEDKQSLDDQWEDAQRLIRDQINLYADEIIKKNWNDGTNLTKDKCAEFAAEVLMHVRTRFYAHIEEEDAIARASGVAVKSDSADGPPTRKLILENMKWIFDNKIKPLTQPLVKELFLCNGCENNSRYYGFEGVVQHYAAKHTTALSSGNVIVFWRAEWPGKPPFHPNPRAAKALFHASSQVGFAQPHGFPRQQGASGIYMGTPEQRHSILPDSSPSSRAYGRSPFKSPYASYMHGPFQPPSPRTSPYYPGYRYPPPSPAMESAAIDPSSAYSSPFNAHVVPASYQTHITQAPHPYPSPAYGSSSPSNQTLPYKIPQSGNRNSVGYSRTATNPDKYQYQLDNMARVAREVWNATSGIKDLPNSIRAHVVVYHVATTMELVLRTDVSIALFTDGLHNRPQMKPIRGLNGLACKSCADRGSSSELSSHPLHSRLYPFDALLSHFRSMHLQHVKTGVATGFQEAISGRNWKTDMIALPDTSALKLLPHNPGMDNFKLRIIAQALPGVFHPPLAEIPPETFLTKRSPAMYQAIMADQRPNYPSPTVHHASRVDYSPISGPLEAPPDNVPLDAVSERFHYSRDPVSRHDSPRALPPHDDGHIYSRGTHYLAQSPRTVIVRARSPRYIRLQDEWAFREDNTDGLTSGHHDRYYIPISTRSTISEHSEYGSRPVLSDPYEGDIRVERQANPPRQSEGQEVSEGSILPNHSASVVIGHEDSQSNAGDLSAAEQFLNTFVPGQETSSELSRNDSSSSISKHTGSRRRIPAGDDSYYSQDDTWNQRWSDNPGVVRGHDPIPREGRHRGRSPEVIQLRSYGRKPSGGTAASITMESSKLPPHAGPSRFDRYEALRQESLRMGSRSPSIAKEDVSRDAPPLYYDDQDPRVQQSRLPPQPQQHMGDRERDPSSRAYVRMERENSISTNSRRNFRTGSAVRDSAYYDDSMEY
ncbi:conserved hypothetical protein [Talaromyces stipitatus ATCC 10500]|uniref:F-box domain-containing protein n=1 Tax=Talaromyces stipitatus (strain ATCC 10500 / CBS 375.48 / QM 6759 / NRRL 1006) TaxID=441959 RepID=B8MHH6_TALSN|nr:uncharacterized protein TSTA_010730 [Talaromyces stipitatus ATCC 10500]EED15957.1 conserved hypothetical protein [Talaromyces stipitatus ATCC 10500]